METGTIKIAVWDKGQCDDEFMITDSNGFSLDTLLNIYDSFLGVNWEEYEGFEIVIEPIRTQEQRGEYPPPNLESEAYWDFKLITKNKMW